MEFLRLPPGGLVELGPRDAHRRPAHVLDHDDVVAVNAALATGRPLLVRGEPGTGKSQLAAAAAKLLGRALIHHAVDGRTEPRDVMYTVDAVARLADAQIMGHIGGTAKDALPLVNYVVPGPLWWAFDPDGAKGMRAAAPPPGFDLGAAAKGVVLLLDEIDKADSSVPNALLDALGHRRFEVPGVGAVGMRAGVRPLVVITTNEERVLPDAFLRRCFVRHLGLPDDRGAAAVHKALVTCGRAHFPNAPQSVLFDAAERIGERREARRKERSPAPGVAEFVDLVDAVLEQTANEADAVALLKEVAKFVLYKHEAPPPPDDVKAMAPNKGAP